MATAGQVLADDPVEQLFEQEVTDGLPVVPPTRERRPAGCFGSLPLL